MRPCVVAVSALIAACLPQRTASLNNGFTKPALGWSSWYSAPDGSQVTEAFMRANAQALIDSGLAKKGFVYVNVDEGWLKGRFAGNNTIYEDLEKFPSGMKGLGDWVKSQPTFPGSSETMRFGLYSCRGTCQCSTDKYSGPGSHGFEAEDVEWMVAAGAQWLKIDSCCGDQDHAVAFADYAKFRDAMNASGTRHGWPVWFNLCGWNPWFAIPDPSLNFTGGGSLGNSYRIWGDGGSFGAITGALNTMAYLASIGAAAAPGAYSDPDNILGPHGTVGAVTEYQARTQMVMWSLAPTQLILGEDMTQASAEYVETVGNDELIAINQDEPFAGAAHRVVGGDLTYPCAAPAPDALLSVHTVACTGDADANQLWFLNSTDGTLRSAAQPDGVLALPGCGDFSDGSIVSVFRANSSGAACAQWALAANGSLVNAASGKCLDEYEWTTPRVDLWTCVPGATNEAWAWAPSGGSVGGFATGTFTNEDSKLCLRAQPSGGDGACTNVWARSLGNGDVALAMLNHAPGAANVTCDAACFAAAGLASAGALRVRDLIAHADLAPLAPPYSFVAQVDGDGASRAFRLSPN